MSQIIVSPLAAMPCAPQLPSSKSISNRALMISALAGGQQWPSNISDCDDTRAMRTALDSHDNDTVNIGAAGTAMRFLTAYFSVQVGHNHLLTGSPRMLQRPIAALVDALRTLGADITYEGVVGFPPLRIRGRQLVGGEVSMPGSVSSQYVSALMMIAPMMRDGLRLRLTGNIVSRPYIDMTMRLMRAYNADVQWTDDNTLEVRPQCYTLSDYRIENDWSAASYWYEMVALAPSADSEVRLQGLYRNSLQGDSRVAEMFEPLGVHTRYEADAIVLTRQPARSLPSPLTIDFAHQPDLAQTFVVTCCMLAIPFCFTGLQSLRIKETDRIAALQTELRKWGYMLHVEGDDTLSWNGERAAPLADQTIDTYADHRMAMSFAPACLVRGRVVVNDPEVVTKSYPHFWDNFCISATS